MIESLGPLVTVFKLFIGGISKSAKAIKSSKNRAIKRKLIEIQLSLEDIIDNAQYLFFLIEDSTRKTKKDNRELVEEFKRALYIQIERLRIFIDQITDNTSGEILKIFTPKLRRDLVILTHRKMSALNWVLSSMYDTIPKISVSKNGLNSIIQPALVGWDHQKFVDEGPSYMDELHRSSKKTKVLISDYLREQKEIIKSLSICSKDFSEFIKKHIDLQATIGLLPKKIRKSRT